MGKIIKLVILGFAIFQILTITGVAEAQTRPALCQSTTVNKAGLVPGDSVTVTATANTTVNKIMFAFFNLDNQKADGTGPQLISYGGSLYVPTIDVNGAQGSKSFSYLDIARPDDNWGGKIPQLIQVNNYFYDSQGNQSIANPACTASFSLAAARSTPAPVTFPLPTASLEGTSMPIRVGETLTFKANLSGGSETGAILIAKKPDGKVDFNCPGGYVQNGYESDPNKGKWCQVASGGTSSKIVEGSFRFLERGEYAVVVNGYVAGGYNGTKESGCSGNPFPYGDQVKNAGRWSDCGGSDNIAINVLANDPPLCTLVADKGNTLKRGEVINFTGYAGDTVGVNDPRIKRMIFAYTIPSLPAQQPAVPGVTRWLTLGNMASTACVPGTNCQAALDTNSLPPETTGFTIACSAFMNDTNTPFAAFYSPENSCTGHPWASAATVDKPWTSTPSEGNPAGGVSWAYCGARSNATFKVIPSCTVSGDLNGDLKEKADEDDFNAWEDAFLNGQSTPAGCGVGTRADLKLFNAWRSRRP